MQHHVNSFTIDAILSDTHTKILSPPINDLNLCLNAASTENRHPQISSPRANAQQIFSNTRSYPSRSYPSSPPRPSLSDFPIPMVSEPAGGNVTLPTGADAALAASLNVYHQPWMLPWNYYMSSNETYNRLFRRHSWPWSSQQWMNNNSRGRNNRVRKGGQIRFTAHQTQILENAFAKQRYLTCPQRQRMSAQLNLSERQVKTWFQNRRAKWRRLKEGIQDATDSDHQSQSDCDVDEVDIMGPTISQTNPC